MINSVHCGGMTSCLLNYFRGGIVIFACFYRVIIFDEETTRKAAHFQHFGAFYPNLKE